MIMDEIDMTYDPAPPEEPQHMCVTHCTNPLCMDPGTPRIVPVEVVKWMCGGCGMFLPPPYCAPAAKHEEYATAFPGAELIDTPLPPCEGHCG